MTTQGNGTAGGAAGTRPRRDPAMTLANWREAPFNRWSFQHVREVVPTAAIPCAPAARPLPEGETFPLGSVAVADAEGRERPLDDMLASNGSSAFLVLHNGRRVAEWHAPWFDPALPHLIFSITKSVSGAVAGILAARGFLDPEAPVAAILPGMAGSAWGDATVRHVLDMTASADVEEAYTDPDSAYGRYRRATGWAPPRPGERADMAAFLGTVPKGAEPHGHAFRYRSPGADLLGLLLERAGGDGFASLVSRLLWAPLGAEGPADVTVDGLGAPRSAGGMSVRLHDLARLGEAVRLGGAGVLPDAWVEGLRTGDRGAWDRGDFRDLFPGGSYRDQWYETGLPSGALAAIGIHGQWLWIDPAAGMTAVRLGAQAEPQSDAIDAAMIRAFVALGRALA
jgi:CubicO group peptidase (beta-lactamase class C family)